MDQNALLEQLPILPEDTADNMFDAIYELAADDFIRVTIGQFVVDAVFTEEEISDGIEKHPHVMLDAVCSPTVAFQPSEAGEKASIGWMLGVCRKGDDLKELHDQYPDTHVRFLHFKDGQIYDVTHIKQFSLN